MQEKVFLLASFLSHLRISTMQPARWLWILLQGRGKPRTEKQPAGFAVAIKGLFYE